MTTTTTTVRIQAIDVTAPGSHRAIKERRKLIAARNAAVGAYNDCVEAFNAQRKSMGYDEHPILQAQLRVLYERREQSDEAELTSIDQEIAEVQAKIDALMAGRTPEMYEGLQRLIDDMESARAVMDAARDAYESHLLTRLVAEDGTPTDRILDLISEADFQQLMRDDEAASVVVKTSGDTN